MVSKALLRLRYKLQQATRNRRQAMVEPHNKTIDKFMKELYNRGDLYGAIEGITMHLIKHGLESLTIKQRNAIENFAQFYIKYIFCAKCSNGNVTELSDYLFIEDNQDNLCPCCDGLKAKF